MSPTRIAAHTSNTEVSVTATVPHTHGSTVLDEVSFNAGEFVGLMTTISEGMMIIINTK